MTPLERVIRALEETNALYAEIALKLEECDERSLRDDLLVRVQTNVDLIREIQGAAP